MTIPSTINSDSYWNARFSENWETCGGPMQSRSFARLAIEHLPRWLIHPLQSDGLTLADWGCAQGDGTDVWAAYIDPKQITGVDFSAVAIEQAIQRYPAIRFVSQDWLADQGSPRETFDVVFSSNTLEHFHRPYDVLRTLRLHAGKALVLALPYRERDRIDEHFYTFLPENIPMGLPDDFRLAWSQVVDCRSLANTFWAGEQIILVYADSRWLDGLGFVLRDVRISHDDDGSEFGLLRGATVARDEQIASLGQSVAERDARLQDLNAKAQEVSDWALQLQRDLEARDQRLESVNQSALQLKRDLEARDQRLDGVARSLVERERELATLIARAKQASERETKLQQDVGARDQEIARLALSLADRESLLRSLNAKALEVSEWAQRMDARPLTYGLKKHVFLLAKRIFHALPVGAAARQRLRQSALSLVRPFRSKPAPFPREGRSVQNIATARAFNQAVRPTKRDVFVFSVIDWHFRIQRPQHLARSFANIGRRVFFFSNHFADADEPGYQIEQLDPALPLFQIKLNVRGAPAIYFAPPTPEAEAMLQASIAKLILDFGAVSTVSLIQHAYWYSLVRRLPNTYRLYDCMDHHEGFGNVPEKLLEIERQMLREVDIVVATSSWLEDFARGYNPSVVAIKNAGEYEHFSNKPREIYVDANKRRIIGYYGAIAEWFDLDLIRKIAMQYPDCLVLLVGNDTVGAQSALGDLQNVAFIGEVPYARLPFFLYAFDVCLLPFKVIPLTLATNPVKVYEYLAAAKPVVSVDLPEMMQFGELVRRARSADEFLQQVSLALQPEDAAPDREQARRTFAAAQTWDHRIAELDQALETLTLPKISVIVLTYNNIDLTKSCLQSLLEQTDYPHLEIIVVDNASSDGTPAYLQEFGKRHPTTTIMLNESNLGFAAGNNIGLACATGDYLVILNNDTVVTCGWAMTLLRHLQADPSIGLIGPVTNNIGNEARIEAPYEQIVDMPYEALQFTLTNMGKLLPMRNAAFFCVMLPRSTYERCGPICEDYGRGFFEDDDYCRRVEAAGLNVVCADDVFVHHHLSASFDKLGGNEKQELFARNKAIYENRWGSWIPHQYRR